ncbi:MAG: glycosyltransferase family 9 protein [Cyclobacteriaceae bacterium]|nr:glycosyltransferase family 9 protein [Cyclobacteriaceae bacterium]
MEIKKILIIRFSSIGDIVLTSPVIRCLKKQLPDIQVHFCTKAEYTCLVEHNPYIDRLHLLGDSLSKLKAQLKKEKFDFVVDLHHNLRSALIKWSLNAKSHSYSKLTLQRQLLAILPMPMPKPHHVVDRYMETVHELGVRNDDEGLDFFIADKDVVELEWLPESHRQGYVAFAIGGTAFTKKLPLEKMIALCDKINWPVILLGGKEDFDNGEKIVTFFEPSKLSQPYEAGLKAMHKHTRVFNGCGKFNLGQSASILKQAEAVFSHDTGLAHIAAAFKKHIFSIFGGTVPLYFYPYGTRFTLLENNKLTCRPCSKNGRDSCPLKHFKCMKENPLDFYLPEFEG